MARKKKTKAVSAKQKRDQTKSNTQSDYDANDTDGLNTSESSDFTLCIEDSDLVFESESKVAARNVTPRPSGSQEGVCVSEVSSPLTAAETIIVNLAEDFSPTKTPSSVKSPTASPLVDPVSQGEILLEEDNTDAVIEETQSRSCGKRRDSESSEDYDYPANEEIEQINIEEMIGGVGPSTDSAYLLYDSVLNSALRSEVGCNIVIEACEVDEVKTVHIEETAATIEFEDGYKGEEQSSAPNVTMEPGPLHVTKKEGDTFYPAKSRRENSFSDASQDDMRVPVLPYVLQESAISAVSRVSIKGDAVEKKMEPPSGLNSEKTLIVGKPALPERDGSVLEGDGSESQEFKDSSFSSQAESFIEKFDIHNTKQCVVRLQDCLTDDAKVTIKTSLESGEPMDTSDSLGAIPAQPVSSSSNPDKMLPVCEEDISSRVNELSLKNAEVPSAVEVNNRPCRGRGTSKRDKLVIEAAQESKKLNEPMDIDEGVVEPIITPSTPLPVKIMTDSGVDNALPKVPQGISIFKLNQPSAYSLELSEQSTSHEATQPGHVVSISHVTKQLKTQKCIMETSDITLNQVPEAANTKAGLSAEPSQPTSKIPEKNIADASEPLKPSRPRRQTRQPKRIADSIKPKPLSKGQSSKVTSLLPKKIPDPPTPVPSSATVATKPPVLERQQSTSKLSKSSPGSATNTSGSFEPVDSPSRPQLIKMSNDIHEVNDELLEQTTAPKNSSQHPTASLRQPTEQIKPQAAAHNQLLATTKLSVAASNSSAAASKQSSTGPKLATAPPKRNTSLPKPVAMMELDIGSPKPELASLSPVKLATTKSSPFSSPPVLTPCASPKSCSNSTKAVSTVSSSLSESDSGKQDLSAFTEPVLFTPDQSVIVSPKPSPSTQVHPISNKISTASAKTASPKGSLSPKQSTARPSASPKRAPSPKLTVTPKRPASPKPLGPPKPTASPKLTPKTTAAKSVTPPPKSASKNSSKSGPSPRQPPVTKAALKAFSPRPTTKPPPASPKGAKGIAKAMAKLAMAKETSSKEESSVPEPMEISKDDSSSHVSHADSVSNVKNDNSNCEDVVMKGEPPKGGKEPKTEPKKEAPKKPEGTRRRSNRIRTNRWDENPAAAAGKAVVPSGHGSAVASMPVSTATAAISTISPGATQPSPQKDPNLPPPPLSALPPPTFETDKPVKVKSRWRRTSELEMGGSASSTAAFATPPSQALTPDGSSSSPAPSHMQGLSPTPPPLPPVVLSNPPPPPPSSPPPLPTPKPPSFVTDHPEIDERLKNFEVIRENVYLTTRHRSKEAKKMVCECTLTEEEIARGEQGCGEDCLNRLLMIECSNRCVLGDLCSNKRFQNCEYSKCTVVKTEKKGLGLIASSNIPSGDFLMEYVGEVLDPKEFRRRAKDYSKEKSLHFYFMALKSDSIIDATLKGNISRFINHSCDPNAETQKWTVNGELRIGFFSKRPIAENEEVTFDYQLQRYGKEAQRCHCESANCRGWIGDEPDKDDKEEKDRSWEKAKDKKDRKKTREELEEEIEKLRLSGIKNRAHTLMLNRLMVRAEDHSSRSQLLSITQADVDQRCLRLFLDYHGLNLLWSWMVDSTAPTSLKVQILDTLAVLPITNKTILQDSKVFGVVERWSNLGNASDEVAPQREEDSSPDSEETNDAPATGKSENKGNDSEDEVNKQTIISKATALFQTWSTLKEEFRIPKKERIEQMKEHEREADRGYVDHDKAIPHETSYDRHWSYDKENSRSKRRGRDSPDSLEWKSRRSDDRNGPLSQLSKMKRRQLFAMKVEEEERQKRLEEERWSNHQEQCYALGVDPNMTYPPQNNGYYHPLDGSDMPPEMFGPGGMGPPQGYPPPPPNSFMPGHCSPAFPPPFHSMGMGPPGMPGAPPGMPGVPPGMPGAPPGMPGAPPGMPGAPPGMPGAPPGMPGAPPGMPNVPPGMPGIIPPGGMPFGVPFPPGGMPPPGAMPSGPSPGAMPPFSNGGMPPMPNPNQPGFPATMFLPGAPPPALDQPPNELMAASNPIPSTVSTVIVLKLPKNWKITLDKDRRASYYYHSITRHVQWTFPSPEEAAAEEAKCAGLKSSKSHPDDSDDSEEEEDESDSEEEESSSDEYEEKEDEEDDEDYDNHLLTEAKRKAQEELATRNAGAETQLINNPLSEINTTDTIPLPDLSEPALKKKREGLVTVNIISPRDEDEDYRKGIKKSKIKETKMKLARQKARANAKKAAASLSGKSKKKAKTCEADTSSGPSRKIKDKFRLQMATVIVTLLNPYRKADCKVGRIVNTEDFKHLARKLTHFVMVKELRHIASIEDLQCNDNVKHKARDFIRKYMSKFGAVYSRSPDD